MGDEQYENGDLADYRSTYSRTWGRLKAISRPVPGNHDYHDRGAAGYFAYFRRETSPPDPVRMVASFEHPTIGTVQLPGIPFHLGETPASIRRPPPRTA